MPVEYTCPSPTCKARMALAGPPKPGEPIQCPTCGYVFVPPRPAAAKPAQAKPATAKPAATKPAAAAPTIPLAPPPPPPPPARSHVEDDFDDSSPYTVVEESEEEQKLAEANKVTFDKVKDKFKRSARGPAMSLLVMPSNLLIAEGGLTFLVGMGAIVTGFWPIVFSDAPPSDEEFVDCLQTILIGIFAAIYGGLICYGASQMQNLGSYAWGIVAGVLGIAPLLAGIFALVTLRDPRVLAGFAEIEGSAIGAKDEDEEDKDKDDDDDDDDDDEDD
ncbi:MAG: hypothetical protein LC104_00150 [Bacteroidales bacterium]|nr:hypothetical protein [Bacteroidales bacterium]